MHSDFQNQDSQEKQDFHPQQEAGQDAQQDIHTYTTAGGIKVLRERRTIPYEQATATLIAELDAYRGALFSSSCDFPGRYTRWDIGFVRPPLQIVARARSVEVEALANKGRDLLPALAAALQRSAAVAEVARTAISIKVRLHAPQPVLFEEERGRRVTVFSLLRELLALFRSPEDEHLGLYGAFGYDLAFQFEEVRQAQARSAQQRDLLLYLPDEIVLVDHRKQSAQRFCYDFHLADSQPPVRDSPPPELLQPPAPFEFARRGPLRPGDHEPGEYAATVCKALDCFRRGDLFEAVPGQMFFARCKDRPSAIFQRLKTDNPAPYGAFINLGEQEYLVSASPEMYVRVKGTRVETCPISGTVARGGDALGDAEQILKLLNSDKDRAELSMCTDVDRNDKARVCEPGSVKLLGRRQIEMYSRLIHTVDHVEGQLRPQFDALDAFLSHAWAVTVTGAPKQAAFQFIEDQEKSPRGWYGGAIGFLNFNGDMNTGLTLRTLRIKQGIAEVRAGATLLYDSDPLAEEAETRLKASALLHAVCGNNGAAASGRRSKGELGARRGCKGNGPALRVLMVDHRDSFVHNLASYFEAAGAHVKTVRPERLAQGLAALSPDLVVLSPGPGRPEDFTMAQGIARVLAQQVPLFGVCLGLQGIVEYFGGRLGRLDPPVHGRPATLADCSGSLFQGLAQELTVGRYHSLAAVQVPPVLQVTARTREGVVMAVEHRSLPVQAVQFHPESILSLSDQAGMGIIRNVLDGVTRHRTALRAPAG